MPASPGPEDILRFWFEEAGPERWWKRDEAFDQEIIDRFSDTHTHAASGALGAWRRTPEGTLALILILDQFSRNMFRGSPKAYACDADALAIARAAIADGLDLKIEDPARRHFFYLPFMHSEVLDDQDLCLAIVRERLGDERVVEEAERHRSVVARYGRFPHRNAVLGRTSTAEEQDYLDGGGGWG